MSAAPHPFEQPTPVGLLDAARESRRSQLAEQVRELELVVEWCAAHEVEAGEAATYVEFGRDTGVSLAGAGAPLVSEFAVVELAAALGMTTDAGRRYVGKVLEVRYRLPGFWEEVICWSAAVVARRPGGRAHHGAAEGRRTVHRQAAGIDCGEGDVRTGRTPRHRSPRPVRTRRSGREEAGRGRRAPGRRPLPRDRPDGDRGDHRMPWTWPTPWTSTPPSAHGAAELKSPRLPPRPWTYDAPWPREPWPAGKPSSTLTPAAPTQHGPCQAAADRDPRAHPRPGPGALRDHPHPDLGRPGGRLVHPPRHPGRDHPRRST